MKRRFASLSLLFVACSFPEYTTEHAAPEQLEQVATCRDGLRNGSEISVDCGPDCTVGCDASGSCRSNAECPTGVCSAGQCVAASCSDGVKNRSETDVDCGGSDGCRACSVGQLCSGVSDCDGGSCSAGRCQLATCGDGITNGNESDVDCGGSECGPCATKQHCRSNGDCDHAQCSQGRCQPASCDDGVLNGDETAVDCGGGCAACAASATCKVSSDCQSLVCSSGTCAAATCADGVLNGDEPDLDCGRSCAQKCGMTRACRGAEDCESGACSGGRCVPSSFTNQALSTSGWLATASHTFSADTTPQKAIDGSLGSHWTNGTGQRPGMWFQVDMLAPQAFFRVELSCTSNDDYPRSLRVLISEDGQTFTPITSAVAGEPVMQLDLGSARVARYVRFEEQEDGANIWWRIDELRVLR